MHKPVIALDADGVLLDYSMAYAKAWERAFSRHPLERDPKAYWPMDRWDVERLSGDQLARFRACFDENFWSTVPAIDGALDACNALRDAGHTLVCVSALEPDYEVARLRNLRALGFPIERVIATNSNSTSSNPKASALRSLDPEAFVDDFAPNFRGLHRNIHTALINGQKTGSPNTGDDLNLANTQHEDLAGFARWWLRKC